MNDKLWMAKAYELALVAAKQEEIPVGAIVVSSDNQLLGCGSNKVLQMKDPCAHAELLAISAAASRLNNYRLPGTTLYVTLEPCAMCAGAMVHARIKRLVFATRDVKAGAAGSVYNLLKGYPLNHQVEIDEGLMQQDCADLLSNFFRNSRR